MFNNFKIRQVLDAIKENGIEAFDDENLSEVLRILSPLEYDELLNIALTEENDYTIYNRINRVRDRVLYKNSQEVKKIRKSTYFQKFIESLHNKTYNTYIKEMLVSELADVKKILLLFDNENPVYKEAAAKISNLISSEIKLREQTKKSPNW